MAEHSSLWLAPIVADVGIATGRNVNTCRVCASCGSSCSIAMTLLLLPTTWMNLRKYRQSQTNFLDHPMGIQNTVTPERVLKVESHLARTNVVGNNNLTPDRLA
jgi:hypothetical protein